MTMQTLLDFMANGYTALAIIAGGSVGAYKLYDNIIENVESNRKAIEKSQKETTSEVKFTQLMILKEIVVGKEKNKCPVHKSEWEEYIRQSYKLHELRIEFKEIPDITEWKPMTRVTKGATSCGN